jgi:dihydroxy-acid dehydratase
MWYEGNTCNMHLNDLAAHVKAGVQAAGWSGCASTPSASADGISMGTDGMSYSLQSRDLIADSIETVMGAHWYDACVAIPGCDKNMPGCIIAMGRLDRPALMVYGGTIQPGISAGPTARRRQRVSELRRVHRGAHHRKRAARDRAKRAAPGAGACGGMYTANTMASAIEAWA